MPLLVPLVPISSWSHSVIGAISVSISWKPSLRRPEIFSGAIVWIDLKLCNIPNIVATPVVSVSLIGVFVLTLHLSDGSEMIRAASEARANNIMLLGVTVLTSATGKMLREIGIADKV